MNGNNILILADNLRESVDALLENLNKRIASGNCIGSIGEKGQYIYPIDERIIHALMIRSEILKEAILLNKVKSVPPKHNHRKIIAISFDILCDFEKYPPFCFEYTSGHTRSCSCDGANITPLEATNILCDFAFIDTENTPEEKAQWRGYIFAKLYAFDCEFKGGDNGKPN